MLGVLACSNPLGGGDHVPAGTWGGEHAALEVTADSGRIEYDCAHGKLADRLALDRRGV